MRQSNSWSGTTGSGTAPPAAAACDAAESANVRLSGTRVVSFVTGSVSGSLMSGREKGSGKGCKPSGGTPRLALTARGA